MKLKQNKLKINWLKLCVLISIITVFNALGQDVIYLEGSTKKIEQLVGDYDRSIDVRDSTRNKTWTRFGVPNTDLGVPFEHNGKTYVAFGDILFGDGDPLGVTIDTDPSDGIDLDFVSDEPGTHITIEVPGVDLAGFGVPLDGVSWNNEMYLYVVERGMSKSVLAKSIDNGRTYEKLYDVSDYKFINISAEKWVSTMDYPEPTGTDIQLIFGSGSYRRSSVYLAYQTAESIEFKNMKYYAGFRDGKPVWVDQESKAVPVFDQPRIGELSVVYNPFIEKWIATMNTPAFTGKNGESFERGINCRTADNPWGPWSDPIVIYTPAGNEGTLGYCHMMHRDWNQSTCDTIQDPGRDYEFGGTYGPYQFGHLAQGVMGSETTIFYTLSLWNPYTVILMESTLRRTGSSPPMTDTPLQVDNPPATQPILNEGLYTISSVYNDGFIDNSIILDFKPNNVTTVKESGYDAQKWRFNLSSDNYYSIINVSTGEALTVENNDLENMANIVVSSYLGTDNQQWQIHPVNEGYRIISKSSGKSLMTEDDFKFEGNGDTRTDAKPTLLGNVVQKSFNNQLQFIWSIEQTSPSVELTGISIGGGNFLYDLDVGEIQTAQIGSLTPANATNVLSYWTSDNESIVKIDSITGRMSGISPGSTIITLTSGNVQSTRIVNVTKTPEVSAPLQDGFYTITTNLPTGQRVDDGFSTYLDTNPNVILVDPTNSPDQIWQFVKEDDGYYRIFRSTSSDSVLAISNGATKPLGNLELAIYDSLIDNPHQKWQIVKYGTEFRIISAFSGLSLEAQQTPPGPITNIRQAYWSNFNRQRWIIEAAENPNETITTIKPEEEVIKLKVYPNPTQISFVVELPEKLQVSLLTVTLFDSRGKIVFSDQVNSNFIRISERLSTGVYQVVVTTMNGKLYKDKLIIME